jgi:hypothetical protein
MMERTSRSLAVVCLLASGAFFAWYALAIGGPSIPFLSATSLAWVVAALGVSRRWAWGPSFAAGLSAVTTIVLLPSGLLPAVAVFLAVQAVLHASLAARAIAGESDERPEHLAEISWRHGGMGFAAGLAMPWLLLVGLLPGLSCGASMLALIALVTAIGGLNAAFRGRTWGLFAMAGAIPLLLAVPPQSLCHATPHDTAGEIAALGLGLALLPWVGPVARGLFGRPA